MPQKILRRAYLTLKFHYKIVLIVLSLMILCTAFKIKFILLKIIKSSSTQIKIYMNSVSIICYRINYTFRFSTNNIFAHLDRQVENSIF